MNFAFDARITLVKSKARSRLFFDKFRGASLYEKPSREISKEHKS